MRFGRLTASVSALLLVAAPAFASHVRRGPTGGGGHHGKPHVSKVAASKVSAHKVTGQRSIDPARATQIQGALIKAGYLSGEPSGTWDAETEAAMEKLQADNGWQTKLVPDARAILKLGLGGGSSTAESTSTMTGGNNFGSSF